MKLFAVVLAVIIGGPVAAADPGGGESNNYLMVGPSLGAMSYLVALGTVSVEAAHRDDQHGVWWRAAVVGGATVSDDASGSVVEARVGGEWQPRHCTSACVYVGLDGALVVGHLTTGNVSDYRHVTGGLAIPRAGLDVGGHTVRFRLGIEGMFGGAQVHLVAVDSSSTTGQAIDGAALTASVGGRF
jgi:hypothetical protein